VLCLIFVCISLTEKLETNKEELQEEVERKTAEILKQNKHLKYLQEQTILGMANIIESRDSETGEHVKRTSRYVELLANAARDFGYYQEQLNAHYIEILKKVAPIHDIGKIAVSDTILQKPARLTTDEFEKIKIHTTEGEKIIREVLGKVESEEYVQAAIDVAKGHHEHWDGTGYPNHLKGEAIPLGARIMAIADVFDALVSPRCYKKALSADAAFEIIRNSSGSHFDPILADLFLKMKDEVLKIMRM
ncbi:MAG: HD domain-containing protein, partial [Treponema sp.]|nr:HD domain-containing protein [Treponema sp.]